MEHWVLSWDGLIQGQQTILPDDTLAAIFFNHIKLSKELERDIHDYESALKENPCAAHMRCYLFLYNATKRHLAKKHQERQELVRDQMVKAHRRPKAQAALPVLIDGTAPSKAQIKAANKIVAAAAAAVAKRTGKPVIPPAPAEPKAKAKALADKALAAKEDARKKGLCFAYLTGNCSKGDQCTFKHEKQKGWVVSKAKAKPKPKPGAPAAPAESIRGKPKSEILCSFHQRGNCKFGDECPFLHKTPGTVAVEVETEE